MKTRGLSKRRNYSIDKYCTCLEDERLRTLHPEGKKRVEVGRSLTVPKSQKINNAKSIETERRGKDTNDIIKKEPGETVEGSKEDVNKPRVEERNVQTERNSVPVHGTLCSN